MLTAFQHDYFRKRGKYEGNLWFKSYFDPGLKFLYYLRKAQRCRPKSIQGIFYRLMLRRLQIKYGYQISSKTEIGDGLYLGHWGMLIVNPGTKIGKNCNLSHGVTIGQTNRGRKKGVPTIGDNVWIGANAVIVGGISIGNNVLIAPNSYVTFSVPDNSVVFGNPAEIKPSEHATEGYINNKVF